MSSPMRGDERDAYLVGGVRTPIGRYGGVLAGVRPDDLAAAVVAEAVTRAGVAPESVEDVVLGDANQAGEDNRNVARMAALLAGLPDSVPGFTINRLCGSGLTAISTAAAMIRAGEADIIVAGGVESMTRAPWVMTKPAKAWTGPGEVVDTSLGWRLVNSRMPALDGGQATISLGETAEEVAALEGITREECDGFALGSHQKAVAAASAGRFDAETLPVGDVRADECPRPDTSTAKLARLPPVFRPGGVVTAGNASPRNDGAAAVVVVSGTALAQSGLTARARIVGSAAVGVPPHLMGLGPVPATEKLLSRLGLSVADLDAIELNEAFAAQSIACLRRLKLDERLVNADGGAIALGHPLGASGARILVTLLGRLERGDLHRGLATMCVGVGQGVAMVLER